MNIDLLCYDGSPIGVTMRTLWGEDGTIGCGGAELALLTMCEEWTKQGHTVRLYNDPKHPNASPFEQLPVAAYTPLGKRDVLINFRSPNPKTVATTNCLKVWWSTDQYTIGNYGDFAGHVDKIVCISPRHQEYFRTQYGITKSEVIDLPVRQSDYDAVKVEKVPNRLIFTSVPARGLDNLWRMYPIVQREIPDVSLVITSDYRLWGCGASNEHFRIRWVAHSGVQYVGAIPRKQLIEEQLKSQVTFSPLNYDELFCIAIAESQYAGSYPVTSNTGALPTTNMGTVLSLDASNGRNDLEYGKAVIDLLRNPDLPKLQKEIKQKAKKRFSPTKILAEWDKKVFNG